MFPLFVFFVILLALLLIRSRNAPARKAAAASTGSWPLKVIFIHPDLGIGGAERLVIDAAVGLKRQQKVAPVDVTMVTNYHNPKRAFTETTDGSLRVVVRGDWIPRHIRNKGHVLFATLRMLWAALVTAATDPDVDVYFVDQVSATMVMLRLLAPKSKVLFYCHFPDQLCDPTRTARGQQQQRRSLVRQVYRAVFDRVEAATMELADSIVCNSLFSRSVTVQTFPRLAGRISTADDVFYPPIDVAAVTREPAKPRQQSTAGSNNNSFGNPEDDDLERLIKSAPAFVSLNRYERKKNIPLALEAFALVMQAHTAQQQQRTADGAAAASAPPPLLFIAGGYDPRLPENVELHAALVARAAALGVAPSVHFLCSITERQKYLLLANCRAVVYTPSGEHFGIVPVEAMAHGKIVVAVNDGGPVESVGPGDVFGFLRPPQAEAFGEAMQKALTMPSGAVAALGDAARERCDRLFSISSFSKNLAKRMLKLSSETRKERGDRVG